MANSTITNLPNAIATLADDDVFVADDTSEAAETRRVLWSTIRALFATAAQGALADTALQPADVGEMALVDDAPSDGSTYGRQDGAWAVVVVPVSSVFGRTGAVTAQAGDYTAALVGAVDLTGDTMSGVLEGFFTADTRANILASSPGGVRIAFATDTEEFLVYDGSDWRVAPLELNAISSTDMGAMVPGGLGLSDLAGYYSDVITDKRLSNVTLGGSARTDNGGLRIDVTQDPDTLEVYLRNAWQTILYDLTVEDGDFRHVPLDEEIYVWRGDSVSVGLNGRPTIQEYEVDMGAYPAPRIIDGGTF